MDAAILLAFLVGLALAAPIWGYDSRDGFASLEYARRQAWWGSEGGPAARTSAGLAWLAPGDWSPARSTVVDTSAAAQAPALACTGALALAAE